MHLYLQGLLSPLQRKNAEDIAAFVDVNRQVIQDFIGIAPWDHRPLIPILVGQVVDHLGQPDGIIHRESSDARGCVPKVPALKCLLNFLLCCRRCQAPLHIFFLPSILFLQGGAAWNIQ